MTLPGTSPQTLATVTAIDGRADRTRSQTDVQICYLALRARGAALKSCLATLDALVQVSGGVEVEIAGLQRHDDSYVLTAGVHLGPRAEIAQGSPEAIRGYELMRSVFFKMFDFYPAFSAAPDAEARHLATLMIEALSETAGPRADVHASSAAV